ncbi:unnamed protein product, partial [Allacma fusca]
MMNLNISNTSSYSTDAVNEISSIKTIKLFYIITGVIEIVISSLAVVLNFVFTLSGLWAPENVNSNVRILYSMGLVGIFQPAVHATFQIVHVLLPFVWKTNPYAHPIGVIIMEAFQQIGYLTVATHCFALCLGHWLPITSTEYKKWLNNDRTLTLIVFCWLFPFMWVPICVCVGGLFGDFYWDSQSQYINFGTRIAIFAPVVLMFIAMTAMLVHVLVSIRTSRSQRATYKLKVKAGRTFGYFFGTFTFGLLPATLFQMLLCSHCFWTSNVSLEVMVWILMIIHSIQLLTMLSNPVFYLWRNNHVMTGMWSMTIS